MTRDSRQRRPGIIRAVTAILCVWVATMPAEAADLVWTNASGGNWSARTNWSPNQVPGPADHVQIVTAGSYSVILDADASVAQLTLGDGSGTPTLVVTPATRRLTVTNGLTVTAGAVLRQGGVLTGALVRVEGRCDWTGGTLVGLPGDSLRLEIANGGRLNLTNNATRTLQRATVTNLGTVRWTVGTLTATAGDNALQNGGTFDFDLAADTSWTVSGTATATRIENLAGGLLQKSGAGDLTLNAVFANDGAVQIDGGSIVFPRGGTNRAQLTVSAGTTLQFSGGQVDLEAGALSASGTNLISGTAIVHLRSGAALNFPGMLFLNGGTFELNSGLPAALGALRLGSGTLRGSDTVEVSGAMSWAAGTLDGLEINARGTLDFPGTATRSFTSGTIRNHSSATWSGGVLQRAGGAADSVFENLGTFELNGAGNWSNTSGDHARLINRGVLRKSDGAGTTLGFRFEQPSGGRSEVTDGSVTFHGGGFSAGVFETGANGTTRFDLGAFELQSGAEVRGGGLLRIANSTFDIQSGVVSAANSGLLEVAGNVSLRLAAGLVFEVDRLILNGGFLEGPGRLSVAGQTDWRTTSLRNGIYLDCHGGLTMTNSPVSSRGFNQATLRNAGLARWTTGQLGSSTGPVLITNAPGGTFEVGDGMRWTDSSSGSALLANDGKFIRLAGGGLTHLGGDFVNRGTNELRGLLELKSNSGTYTQTAGRTILTGGTLRAQLAVAIDGGTVEGNGTIDATLTNGGSLKPGASPGQIHITGDLIQSAAGRIEVELAGTAAGAFDLVQVDGQALLGGTIQPLPVGATTPQPGDTYPFLTSAGGRTGVFEHLEAAAGPPWFEVLEQTGGAALRVLTGPPLLTITLDVAPTVTISAEQRLTVPVTVSFPGGDVDVVTLSAQFSDPTLVPQAGVSFSGAGRARMLSLRPDLLRSGTTLVTVNALGAAGGTTNASFTLEITPAPPQGLVAWEPFDYSPANASLNTKNGGFGFATPWFVPTTALNARIAPNSLPHPLLRTAGNNAAAPLLSVGIGSLTRRLTQSLGTLGTTRYLSFLIRPDGTVGEGNFNGFFGLLLPTAVAPNLFLGKPGGGATNEWAIEDAGGTFQQASGVAVASGQVALLVARFDFENGNDRVSFFVNPDPGQPEPATPNAVRADRDLGKFQELTLNSAGAWSVDELRVGTTWESVTPDINQIAPLGLHSIPDQSAQEHTFFSYAVQLQESVAPREAHFELIGAPAGMQINEATGLISWTPGEDDGGHAYEVTVRVHDLPEPPARSATTTARFDVLEDNQPPTLAFIPQIQLELQPPRPFQLQLVATDPDRPANPVTFQEVSGPSGLSMTTDGLVTWTPPADQPAGATPVRVRLTDFNTGAPAGSQMLSHEEDVILNVLAAGPDPTVTLTGAPAQVDAGSEAVFEVMVRNRGTLPAADVKLLLSLPDLVAVPPRATLLDATPSGSCVFSADGLVCTLGTMAPDAAVAVKLHLSFAFEGSETLAWEVSTPGADLNPANNRADAFVQVLRPMPATPPNPPEWQVQTAADEGELTAVRIAADPEGLPNLLSQLNTSKARLSIWDGHVWRQSGGADDPPGGFPIAFRMLGESREALLAPNPAQVNYFADLGFGVHYPLRLKDDNANPRDWPGYGIVRDALLPGGSVGRDDTAILYRVFHSTDNLLDTWQDRTLARITNLQDGWPLVPPDLALLHPRSQFVFGTAVSFGDREFVAAVAQKRTNGLPPVMQIAYLPALTPGLDGWEEVQTLCEIPAFDTFAYDELRYPPVAAARVGDRRVAVYADCGGGVWFAERSGTLWQAEQITGVPAGVIRNLAVTLAPDGSPLVALVLDAPCPSSPPCPVDRRWFVAQRKAAWEFSQLENVRNPDGGDPAPAGGTVVPGPEKFTVLDGGLDVQFQVQGPEVRLAYNTGHPAHDIRLARLAPRWSLFQNLGLAGPNTYPRLALDPAELPKLAWDGTLNTDGAGLHVGSFTVVRGGLDFSTLVAAPNGHPANLGISADGPLSPMVVGDPAGQESHRVYFQDSTSIGFLSSQELSGLALDQPTAVDSEGNILGILPDGRPARAVGDDLVSSAGRGWALPQPLSQSPFCPPRRRYNGVCPEQGRRDDCQLLSLSYRSAHNELRIAQFNPPVSDVLLTTVDISSLPHGERPLLRACWTLHASFDDPQNRGFVYAVYPRRDGETISIRVGRVDLAATPRLWEEVTLRQIPPLPYGVQSVAIAATRESLEVAFTDQTAYRLRADGISDIGQVENATLEELPFAVPALNIDVAAGTHETWMSYVSGNRVHVAAFGALRSLSGSWNSSSEILLTPVIDPLCPMETIWIFGRYHSPPRPNDGAGPLVSASRSPRITRQSLRRHGTGSELRGLASESLADPRLDTFRDARDLMLQTAEGRRLEALYRLHTPEVRRLLITNPDLLLASGSLLLNFAPSLDEWLRGKGANPRVTRSMAAQVDSVWSRLAAGASPELKGALLAEQTRFHHFADFAGQTFDQWAALLQFPSTASTPVEFRILATDLTGGKLAVTVKAQNGVRFVLQRVADLGSASWRDVPNFSTITGDGEVTLADPDASAGSAFYRVVGLAGSQQNP